MTYERLISRTTEAQQAKVRDACLWLASFGSKVTTTRFGKYAKFLSYVQRHFQLGEIVPDNHKDPLFTAVHETEELIRAFEVLAGKYGKEVESLLNKISNGPFYASHEQTGNASNAARNFLFELLVFTHLAECGLDAGRDEKLDSFARVEGRTYLFQCKRIQRKEALSRNLSNAEKQLTDSYSTNLGPRPRGVIAIDVSKAINPLMQAVTLHPEQELGSTLESLLQVFFKDNQSLFRRPHNSRTVAYYLRIAMPILVLKQGFPVLTPSEFWMLIPTPFCPVADRIAIEMQLAPKFLSRYKSAA